MDSLEQKGAGLPEMPRFDDGMVNVQELIHAIAESAINEVMDAQAEDACAEGNQCNGYRERDLVTSVGTVRLRIPKLRRGSYFPDDLLVRYSRADRAVVAAVSEMVTSGVSVVCRTFGTLPDGFQALPKILKGSEMSLAFVSWPQKVPHIRVARPERQGHNGANTILAKRQKASQ